MRIFTTMRRLALLFYIIGMIVSGFVDARRRTDRYTLHIDPNAFAGDPNSFAPDKRKWIYQPCNADVLHANCDPIKNF